MQAFRNTICYRYSIILLAVIGCSGYGSTVKAQDETPVIDTVSGKNYKVVYAGKYANSKFHKFLFGHHYREEWAAHVKVPVIYLDKVEGGLRPYEAGGGRQSKTLRLRNSRNEEYVLRSLDKSFGRAMPELYQNTFVEDLVDDQVTIGHPYSAFTIPPMAEAAGIYHTNPVMGYVPDQSALDSFNEDFGNRLYLLEQRPDENWERASNFGNAKKIISTEKLIEKVIEDHDNRIDQLMYVRARLFDIMIGDWGRHEDQWRWGEFESGKQTIYRPIPRDRDQAYSKFDGVLPKVVLSTANLDHLQTFNHKVKELNIYGFPARHLDRFCMNSVPRDQWDSIAVDLQRRLTDEVIETAIGKMPPEVFPIRGSEIISKLKSRRDYLRDYALQYYKFLAQHVDIEGSEKEEFFEVRRINDNETVVNIYKLGDDRQPADTPFYSRLFTRNETKEIRLYGISGKDVYSVSGNVGHGIKLRLIGGPDIDSIANTSTVEVGRRRTSIYDDRDNVMQLTPGTKRHFASDSAIHAYNYREYEYHNRGIRPMIFYNNPDRIYVSLGYSFSRHKWRKYPYGFEQAAYVRYSISQNAFSLLYKGKFNQLVGKWDLALSANYDAVLWTNFFGVGNETKQVLNDRNYYRYRSRVFMGNADLQRRFGQHHAVRAGLFFQTVRIINDESRFLNDAYTEPALNDFHTQKYAGARADYTYQDVNDLAVPTKGMMFYSGAGISQNIHKEDRTVGRLDGILQFYIPVAGKFSLSLRAAGSTVTGKPEFFQLASVGGSQTLRGFRRDRFWGETSFYSSNEIRYITDLKSYVMNGKIGVVALFDAGRVWQPGENSTLWHRAVGGGILIAPFNKVTASFTYAVSEESGLFHLRLNTLLSNL